MGIHDREYARFSGGGFGQRPRRGQKPWSVNTWLIAICVVVFVLDGFMGNKLIQWLHFSTADGFLGIQFWRFFGFQFLHANLPHLLFNMIALYFFGPLVEQYLGGKRYLAFYLLCGLFGAVLYMILNLGGVLIQKEIPGLLFNDIRSPLVGASAGVFGVLLAGAFLAPKVKVLVFFVIPMQLKTMAYVLVGIAVYTVLTSGRNAGGEAAHLGGAAAGWYFIRNPRHLAGFFDFLGKADPTSEHFAFRKIPKSRDEEVDRILDKVHRDGLPSLSAKEKKILHDASRTRREEH
ncbi:MAG: rhomboid family intramembrane serine protease [Phycisphaerales bacterium]|jgi:membrane associated rhomboid family serine protease|nr:rhomboid family intramembrane serine protease [Phycisphaerales bacterium]